MIARTVPDATRPTPHNDDPSRACGSGVAPRHSLPAAPGARVTPVPHQPARAVPASLVQVARARTAPVPALAAVGDVRTAPVSPGSPLPARPMPPAAPRPGRADPASPAWPRSSRFPAAGGTRPDAAAGPPGPDAPSPAVEPARNSHPTTRRVVDRGSAQDAPANADRPSPASAPTPPAAGRTAPPRPRPQGSTRPAEESSRTSQ